MIVIMRHGASRAQIANVVARVEQMGCQADVSQGEEHTVIGVIGNGRPLDREQLERMSGVERTVPVAKPFKRASRDFHPLDTVVPINGVQIGGEQIVVIAGPCAVESREQLFSSAAAVHKAGARVLRGDAFKPRTSPYSFQGLGERGLELLAEARAEFGMPFVAEVVDPRDVELLASYADIIRIGTRNMANFTLLAELGRQDKPVMLKRGFTATVEEWLNAAEYIYKEGNHHIILCERGIRTFESQTRNTLDISAVPVVRHLSHLPVLVDPSHSGGRSTLVAPLSLAAVAVRSNGVMIDVHPSPETALVDGAQAILPRDFADLMGEIRAVAAALGVDLV